MPIWAEKALDTIVSKYSKTELTNATARVVEGGEINDKDSENSKTENIGR